MLTPVPPTGSSAPTWATRDRRGLHGKDLSKADVSVNIYAWLKAQGNRCAGRACLAIGDDAVDGIPYERIVETARTFIDRIGGFEKFAEWGLIC